MLLVVLCVAKVVFDSVVFVENVRLAGLRLAVDFVGGWDHLEGGVNPGHTVTALQSYAALRNSNENF
jgi:hypothetical protein